MRRQQLMAAALLALAAALWGFCYRLDPHQPEAAVEVISLAGGGPGPVLSPGESAPGGVSVLNRGNVPCRLRLRLCAPQVNGQAVLEAGDLTAAGFEPIGREDPQAEEYWRVQGEYLYYQNHETDGLLLPGKQTPAAYSAVRVSERLEPEAVELLRLMGEQQLHVVAQTQMEDGTWATVGG